MKKSLRTLCQSSNTAIVIVLSMFLALSFTTSCDDEDTYADMRERERDQIQAFLKHGTTVLNYESGDTILHVPANIRVISESEFFNNDSTTNVSDNEYVLFSGSGVYMQIVRKGTGSKLAEGESCTVLNRFIEFNIASDTISATNRVLAYETMVDKMTCSNTYGTISGSFLSGIMKSLYGSAAVPSAWLLPLNFINLGRQDGPDAEIALIRLIVPSTEGQTDASTNVYPCFYEISYQKGR